MKKKSSKDWIEKAINPDTKGSFSGAAKKKGESTEQLANEDAAMKGKMGRKARMAKTLMSIGKK